MMNSQVIDLNNKALKELKEEHNLLKAFELLSHAVVMLDAAAGHNHDPNIIEKEIVYRFFWEDCSSAFTQTGGLSEALNFSEGTSPFLCFRFLKISLDAQQQGQYNEVDSVCSCGLGWVVRYNFGILCSALGIFAGESRGQLFLEHGFQLLQHVMDYAESRGEMSSHWLQIQLSVLNNQACIFHACSMRSETSRYLDRIRDKLDHHVGAPSISPSSSATSSGGDLGYDDAWATTFYLNIQILSRDHGAGAA